MKKAAPNESLISEEVIFELRISEKDFKQLFYIEFDELDILAAPEPSLGAMVCLESGQYLVLIYGKVTKTLTVLKPPDDEAEKVLAALFNEVPGLIQQEQNLVVENDKAQ
jgi:hypothetical protein